MTKKEFNRGKVAALIAILHNRQSSFEIKFLRISRIISLVWYKEYYDKKPPTDVVISSFNWSSSGFSIEFWNEVHYFASDLIEDGDPALNKAKWKLKMVDAIYKEQLNTEEKLDAIKAVLQLEM